MENQETTSGNIFYVNIEKGSARGAGTIEAPMKDIQKAIDSAADGMSSALHRETISAPWTGDGSR